MWGGWEWGDERMCILEPLPALVMNILDWSVSSVS